MKNEGLTPNVNVTTISVFLLLLGLCFGNARAANPTDYLILQNIGSFHNSGKGKCGNGAGFLGAADHFSQDHNDVTCRTGYYNMAQDLAVSLQVTQHSGSDSDKWLLHEVEDGYRDGEMERLGLLTKGTRLRDINGNKILSLRGSGYSWICNNVAIEISYTDLQGTKPEPLEVVQAYLQKFPSTFPSTLVVDTAHSEQWIKDEMDRRLWLCDKWDEQFQLGKVTQNDLIKELVDHMNIFLDYREKYYGINAKDDKIALLNYKEQNDLTSIKNKLADYKTWWTGNKNNAITLP